MSRNVKFVKRPDREIISIALSAFNRLEAVNRLNNITIYNAKWEIVKSVIADFLATLNMRSNFFSTGSA